MKRRADKTAAWSSVSAMPDALVSADWLAGNLGNSSIKPIDATWYLPPTDRNAASEYAASHIPGAVYFDIDAIADQASGLPHTMPSAAQFADAVGALGIHNDDHVIVYDSQGIYSAPRVWWMFRAFGHDRVSVLNGGLPGWRRGGHQLTADPTNPAPNEYRAHPVTRLVAGLSDVRKAIEDAAPMIADVRAPGRFKGTAAEPRPGVRSGHMPGARNLHYAQLLDEAGEFYLPPAELHRRFSGAGLDGGGPVITTCGSGVTACILSLGLELTGNDNWAVYDGSWSEWGSRNDTPIEGPSRG